MVVGAKSTLPEKRRVPNVRNFTKDRFHPDCYTSQEDAKDKTPNEKKKKIPVVAPKEKKVVFDQEVFDRLKSKAKVSTVID
jgi:hypothetical protein